MDEIKRCRQCQYELKPDETFCPSCGDKVVLTGEDVKQRAASISMKYIKQVHKGKIQSGRTAILVVAILTAISGVILYAAGKDEIARAQMQIEAARAGSDVEGENFKKAYEGIRKAEDMVLLLLIVTLFMAALYMALWFWAKTNPFPASLIALLIYLAMWGWSVIINPANLVAGIIIKLIIVAILMKAVTSAYKYHKMVDANV